MRSRDGCHTDPVTAAAPTVAASAPTAERESLLAPLLAKFCCSMIAANVVGGAIVFLFLGFVLPRPQRYFDANVISLGQRMMSLDTALELIRIWLETPFDGGRHLRRIGLIDSTAG